jgi:hypothetical protein
MSFPELSAQFSLAFYMLRDLEHADEPASASLINPIAAEAFDRTSQATNSLLALELALLFHEAHQVLYFFFSILAFHLVQ